MPATYTRTTADGRYGLTGPDEYGYHTLWRIASPEAAAKHAADIAEDPELAELIGADPDYSCGLVGDPENIETAADAADEEMRCMLADARAEFGAL